MESHQQYDVLQTVSRNIAKDTAILYQDNIRFVTMLAVH